jgi:hypothetical protein
MRIISDFHDYYDIGVSYGVDPKCVYARDSKEFFFRSLTADNPRFIQLAMSDENLNKLVSREFHATGWTWTNRRSYRSENYDVRLILFCGVLHLAVGFRGEYYYDIDSLGAAVAACGDTAVKEYFYTNPKNRFYGNEERDIRRAFEKVDSINLRRDFLDEVLIAADAPVVEFHNSGGHGSGVTVTVNPELKSLGFPRVMDTFSAFQTLSQYLTNVLGIKPNPTLEVDDSVRIAKHGFDAKSFRKEKKEPKR